MHTKQTCSQRMFESPKPACSIRKRGPDHAGENEERAQAPKHRATRRRVPPLWDLKRNLGGEKRWMKKPHGGRHSRPRLAGRAMRRTPLQQPAYVINRNDLILITDIAHVVRLRVACFFFLSRPLNRRRGACKSRQMGGLRARRNIVRQLLN